MSLIQSARLNGHDPYVYLKDVLTRLPTQRASEIGNLCRIHVRPGNPPFELCIKTGALRVAVRGL